MPDIPPKPHNHHWRLTARADKNRPGPQLKLLYDDMEKQLHESSHLFGIAVEKAVVSYTTKPFGQYMLQDEVQKVLSFQCSGFCFSTGDLLQSQDLDDVLFTLRGIVDFRASLHPGTPEVLAIEYRKNGRYPVSEKEIRAALSRSPVFKRAVECGSLMLAGRTPVDGFTIRHTRKGTIRDLRTEEERK